MLYDVFISHASQDKDSFVRPLAEALREKRVEVWFDEFSLRPGMSLRRSIDSGLAKSRFGIVVLSPSFFDKSWPEWELNGLVQRHLAGSQNVLLPIWHGVSRETVASYSPSLADIFAMRSADGPARVTEQILEIIQPSGSALVLARNLILARGYEPPVISDDWWLDVIEGTEGQDGYRWCFPVWRMTGDSIPRGQRLGWVVMQHLWQQEAEVRPITQMTPPDEVIQFIVSQPGLMEVCERMPRRLLEFAPQLAIPGFAGPLERRIEEEFQLSVCECADRPRRQDKFGSAITINGLCPACDEEFALRHPTFGDYEPAMIACGFVQGNGAGLGPLTKTYPAFDHLVWLLSSRSDWLLRPHHAYLLKGMKEWTVWPWMGKLNDSDYDGSHSGALWQQMHNALDSSKRSITITPDARADLSDRIQHSRDVLGLPESLRDLIDRFMAEQVFETWLYKKKKMRNRRQA
jgi:hypothetical protein